MVSSGVNGKSIPTLVYAKTQDDNRYRDDGYFMKTVAHEYGHILGIADLYGDSGHGNKDAPLSVAPFYDLMRTTTLQASTSSFDIVDMLRVRSSGDWQDYRPR
jgi:hypothetical protein